MKYYATIESERAIEAQGGQKFIKAQFTADKLEVLGVIVNDKGVQVFDDKGTLVFKSETKGEKEKGERCECLECKHPHDIAKN